MHDGNRAVFADGMVKLRASYGNFFGDDREWKQRVDVYFSQLRRHELDDVRAAFARAPNPDFYPDRFPTVGQLQRLVIAAELERKQGASAERRVHDAVTEDERLREEFSLIPIGSEAQAAYIAAANTPLDRLAREWQCESKRLNLDPTKPSPPEIQARRLREFWDMWGRSAPQTRATPEYRTAEVARRKSREPGEDDDREVQEQPPATPASPGAET